MMAEHGALEREKGQDKRNKVALIPQLCLVQVSITLPVSLFI